MHLGQPFILAARCDQTVTATEGVIEEETHQERILARQFCIQLLRMRIIRIYFDLSRASHK